MIDEQAKSSITTPNYVFKKTKFTFSLKSVTTTSTVTTTTVESFDYSSILQEKDEKMDNKVKPKLENSRLIEASVIEKAEEKEEEEEEQQKEEPFTKTKTISALVEAAPFVFKETVPSRSLSNIQQPPLLLLCNKIVVNREGLEEKEQLVDNVETDDKIDNLETRTIVFTDIFFLANDDLVSLSNTVTKREIHIDIRVVREF
jgi:hypothetical protein